MEFSLTIVAYTGAVFLKNPDHGGCGVLLTYPDGQVFEHSEGALDTSLNRMELMSAIMALERSHGPIKIYTDSAYVKNGITSWISTWKKNGWVNSKNQQVKNKDLWEHLWYLTNKPGPKRVIEWVWAGADDPLIAKTRAVAFAEAEKVCHFASVVSLEPRAVEAPTEMLAGTLMQFLKEVPADMPIVWAGAPLLEETLVEVPEAFVSKLDEASRACLIEKNSRHYLKNEVEVCKVRKARILGNRIILT